MNKKNVAEAEDLDVNAGIHGNWNIDNGKGMLHQFLQMNKINADYSYSKQGGSFVAEMNIFVKVNYFILFTSVQIVTDILKQKYFYHGILFILTLKSLFRNWEETCMVVKLAATSRQQARPVPSL